MSVLSQICLLETRDQVGVLQILCVWSDCCELITLVRWFTGKMAPCLLLCVTWSAQVFRTVLTCHRPELEPRFFFSKVRIWCSCVNCVWTSWLCVGCSYWSLNVCFLHARFCCLMGLHFLWIDFYNSYFNVCLHQSCNSHVCFVIFIRIYLLLPEPVSYLMITGNFEVWTFISHSTIMT